MLLLLPSVLAGSGKVICVVCWHIIGSGLGIGVEENSEVSHYSLTIKQDRLPVYLALSITGSLLPWYSYVLELSHNQLLGSDIKKKTLCKQSDIHSFDQISIEW